MNNDKSSEKRKFGDLKFHKSIRIVSCSKLKMCNKMLSLAHSPPPSTASSPRESLIASFRVSNSHCLSFRRLPRKILALRTEDKLSELFYVLRVNLSHEYGIIYYYDIKTFHTKVCVYTIRELCRALQAKERQGHGAMWQTGVLRKASRLQRHEELNSFDNSGES